MNVDDELRLDAQLLEAALALAREIVRFRAVPLRSKRMKDKSGKSGADVWFRLTQDLQAVPGALAAFKDDAGAIRSAVAAFVRFLRDHPHDDYDADFSEDAINDHWLAVVDNWDRMRVPGGDTLTCAFRDAGRAPIELRPPASTYGAKFTLLVSTAWYLQRYQGEEPIMLPVKRLAGLLGYSDHTPVTRLLSLARRLGLLVQLAPGSRNERQAALYRFDVGNALYGPPATEGAEHS